VESANNEPPERQEGQLQFCGPSATSGYYRNPNAMKQLFSGDWLNTGDLAYIADGELFVTGRIKDIIIRAGRNLYPQELEEAVGDIEGIRKGRVAVFSSKKPEDNTEQLVVMAETRETDPEARQHLVKSINTLANDLIGATVDQVVLAPPGTILKTSSGKIRRAACRESYEGKHIGKKPKSVTWQVIHLLLTSLKPQLKRFRRTSATLIYGFYGIFLFYLIAALVWSLVAILPFMNQRWFIMRLGTKLLAKLTATPLKIKGVENLPPPQQPCVFVANHSSYLDGPILVTALKRSFSFVAKKELVDHFIPRTFLKRIGSHFVERFDTEKSIEDTQNLQRLAESGQSLLFFPEGTFTRIPGLLPFHMGAFMIAAKAGLPVVPVTIRGTRSILRGNTKIPRRGTITVSISQPVYPTAEDTDSDNWKTAINLQHQTRRAILKTCGEPDLERL
jgi:1-acyl-sn-glycerol-3-phosphate acyltransferase